MMRSHSDRRRWLMDPTCLVAALIVAVLAEAGCAGSPTARGGRHGSGASQELASVPAGARAPISDALGRVEHAYWLRGFRAINPVQRLRASFAPGTVRVDSGPGRLALSLAGYGHGGIVRPVGAVRPRVSANRVTFSRGALREWYANGPLGLEQGFDMARAPAGGTGPLTFALGLNGNLTARMHGGSVVFSRAGVSLRYGGLSAIDARGRVLRAWLELSGARLLVYVDDRRARYPLHVDPFIGQAKLTAGDGGANDQLGMSVAVSGETVVVGSPDHKVGNNIDQGAIYVFVRPASGWASTAAATAKLTASDGAANDWLGRAVAASGDTIVAGAPYHLGHGAVYVFVKPAGGWASTGAANAELTASDSQPGAALGYSVAVSGETIAAGDPGHKVGNNTNQGAAYAFVKPAAGWNGFPTQAGELIATDGAEHDALGHSVAVSGDTIVAGAVGHAEQLGAAYVFVRPATGWNAVLPQTAELTASDGVAGDQLGISVGVSGDTAVVGADDRTVANHPSQGAAYVFVKQASGWATTSRPAAELTAADGGAYDNLGYSVAVSGNTIIAGASSHAVGLNAYQGAAYVFLRPTGGWATSNTPNGELTAADGAVADELGSSVAIAGDTAVAGAPQYSVGINRAQGAAYVFMRPPPSVTITSPRDGAHYRQGEVVNAAFACADQPDGSGLASCAGSDADATPIDTSVPGTHMFSVTAADNAGEQSRQSVTYTVDPGTLGSGQHTTAAPTISRIAQTHRIWRAGSRLATISRTRTIPIGTTFSFTLDQPARIVLAFTKRAAGRRVGRRCVTQTTTNRRRPACQRALAAGTLTLTGRTGATRVSFQGRVSRTTRLTPGIYTLAITAVNVVGQRSKPRSLAFTIVR